MYQERKQILKISTGVDASETVIKMLSSTVDEKKFTQIPKIW